ncbi:MAG: FtsQ-type POTRA domain-containing protein [bacterium]|nr:FtsQ-type POTRA domain-containing protein [bacterium]
MASFLFLLFLGGKEVYLFFFTSSFFKIKEPIININDEGIDRRFKEYCYKNYITTTPNIFKIDIRDLRDYLTKIPDVKEVIIERGLPDIIKINVIKRKPLAIIPKGTAFLGVDKEGVVFPLDSFQDLPIITGVNVEEEGKRVKNIGLQRALTIISQMKENQSSILDKISEFNVEDPNDIVSYFTEFPTQIHFREMSKQRLQEFKYVLKHIDVSKLQYIDLRFQDIVIK